MFKVNARDRAQLTIVDTEQIPFVAILAPKELTAGMVRIKAQVGKAAAKDGEGDERGEEVQMTEVVKYLKEKLGHRD